MGLRGDTPDHDERFRTEPGDLHGFRVRSTKSGLIWSFHAEHLRAKLEAARLNQLAVEQEAMTR